MDEGEDLRAEAEQVFEVRRAIFIGFGYSEADAMTLAFSETEPNDLHDRIADLQRRGCPAKLAREIAR